MIVDELRRRLPDDCVLTDPAVTAGYARDQATWAPSGLPAAVVRPRTTDQVRQVVWACLEHRVPLVARGAGTGLAGAANAAEGGVVISTERMNRVVRIDAHERLAVVEPGVVNDDLRAAAADHGLWYPPDPASSAWSTIGGNVATNAGGLCCVKYGVTRDYVLGLEVVDGRGNLLSLGRQTAKGVAGLDLAGLMVGSEGTLGIVTQVALRLRPLPAPAHTVVAGFESLRGAGAAVNAIRDAGLIPSALELLDATTLAAIDAWKRIDVASGALVLAQTDTPGQAGLVEAEMLLARFEDSGSTWATRSTDHREAKELFAVRRLAYPAVERMGDVLTEDVCVPIGALSAMLDRVERAADRHRIAIATIAHAGDGNLHPMLVTPRGDDRARRRAALAFDDIVEGALQLGGTITGEHGVGVLKIEGLRRELSAQVLDLHMRIKTAFDPYGILNPGKVVELNPMPAA